MSGPHAIQHAGGRYRWAVCALLSVPEAGYWPLAFIAALAAGAASLALLSVARAARRSLNPTKQGATS